MNVPTDAESHRGVPADAMATSQDLTGATVRGVGWTAGAQLGRQLGQIVVTIVIARSLAPEAFGQIAQIMVFAGLAQVLADFGFGEALVQRRDLEDRHVNAVFWLQAGGGVVLAGLLAAAGPLIAGFYDDPDLVWLTAAIAPTFVFTSSGAVHAALLARSLQFRRLALVHMTGLVVSGVVAIGAASFGLGVMSLVLQQLTMAAATSAGFWVRSRWRPHSGFDASAIRELLPYSKNLIGFAIINYSIRNVDNLLVGRLMGAPALGVYSRGYSILLLPSRRIAGVVGKVMFASLSRLQDDVARLRRNYLRAISMIALITFPVMAGLALVAEEFVLVVLGPQWRDAIGIIRIFAIVGITESIVVTVGWIYKASGRTDALLRWGLWAGGIPIAGIAIGSLGGTVETVAMGYAGATVILLYPCFHFAGRLIELRVGTLARALAPTAGCALVMSLAVFATRVSVLGDTPDAIALATMIGVGGTIYFGALMVFRVRALQDLRTVVTELRSSG